ncbi:MAG: hypothetical protein ACI9X4_001115 [Glaciecola sp.]|jgi:hypothetical protein
MDVAKHKRHSPRNTVKTDPGVDDMLDAVREENPCFRIQRRSLTIRSRAPSSNPLRLFGM